jgi:hypothetical protein
MDDLTFGDEIYQRDNIFVLDDQVDLDAIDYEKNFDLHYYLHLIKKGFPIRPDFEESV